MSSSDLSGDSESEDKMAKMVAVITRSAFALISVFVAVSSADEPYHDPYNDPVS